MEQWILLETFKTVLNLVVLIGKNRLKQKIGENRVFFASAFNCRH